MTWNNWLKANEERLSSWFSQGDMTWLNFLAQLQIAFKAGQMKGNYTLILIDPNTQDIQHLFENLTEEKCENSASKWAEILDPNGYQRWRVFISKEYKV